jgi:hypothetical protein
MAKEFVVKHTVLGINNPETGEDYRQGEVVKLEVLGDKANQDRLIKAGAIGEKATEDKREETPGSPSEAEELALEQSQIVDLDPAASPLADHQELTDQQLNKDQAKANNKSK